MALMKPHSRFVHLQYRFGTADAGSSEHAALQHGAQMQNPLFDLLSALREHGSIQQAARAAGVSYRHFWGALKHWQEVLGQPLVSWTQGQPARLTPFALRLLWGETQARTRLAPHIEALRSELARVLDEALEGTQQVLTLTASHDLALPRLRDLAAEHHRLHLELRFAGSVDALQALAAGRCAVAGFHVPVGAAAGTLYARRLKPLLKPGRHQLIGCARRVQGLVVAAGNPHGVRSLADVAAAVAQGARFVPRQDGSGTRLLFEHLCANEGLEPVRLLGGAHAEDSHLALAAAVASGQADFGLGSEAAARAFGLGFVPLVEERYFLCCLADRLDEAPMLQLREVLRCPVWHAELAELPGYAPDSSGEVLGLNDALAWWGLQTTKAA